MFYTFSLHNNHLWYEVLKFLRSEIIFAILHLEKKSIWVFTFICEPVKAEKMNFKIFFRYNPDNLYLGSHSSFPLTVTVCNTCHFIASLNISIELSLSSQWLSKGLQVGLSHAGLQNDSRFKLFVPNRYSSLMVHLFLKNTYIYKSCAFKNSLKFSIHEPLLNHW